MFKRIRTMLRFYRIFTKECIPYGFNREAAQEVYDFIATHLEVVNNEPTVEDLMMWLETTFDLVDDE